MASRVLLEPAPAITGTRPFAAAMVISTTRLCSRCDSVGLSPVVPQGTKGTLLDLPVNQALQGDFVYRPAREGRDQRRNRTFEHAKLPIEIERPRI